MKKRVFFTKGYQRKFIDVVKNKSGLTWKELAEKLELKYTTLSKSYRFEYCSIPYKTFKRMVKIFGENENTILNKYKGQIKNEIKIIGRKVFGEQRKSLNKINISYTNNNLKLDVSLIKPSKYDLERNIKIPTEMSSKLAEEIGMHFGDGFLSSKRYDYRLKGNPKDEKKYYIDYIKPLFKELYNIDVGLKESWKSFGFELRSKAIWEFKTKILGIKSGKKYKITIPEILKVNNTEILAGFLRGLFDTDGYLRFKSQYGYGKYYPTISLDLTSKEVIKEVALILKMFGFNIWLGFNERYGRISLNGISNFKRYRELIGWSSQKNLNKVKDWEERYPELNL
jgi:hypothetical protein|tara:strand:+ start:105 stop:1124 length:1020 start_codon:yes stop_codon:yes gene_type:complete